MKPLPRFWFFAISILLLPLMVLSGVVSPAQGRESGFIGRIVQVEGYGIIVRVADGREVPAAAGLNLFSGDKVSAGPMSEIRIITSDGSLFWLGQESILEMGELETTDRETTTLTVNLPAGYLKTAAENFDKSRQTLIQVWTENAVASISEDAMIVVESQDGTMVVGFDFPAKVYGREHPDLVETVLDGMICVVPFGSSAQAPRTMEKGELSFFGRLFTLGATVSGEPGPETNGGTDPKAAIPNSTTTTTTTDRRAPTTTLIVTTTTSTSTSVTLTSTTISPTTTTILMPQ